MHEASLAQSIVETVLRYAEANHAAEVKSVQIDLGELTFFNEEQVSFWMHIGFEKTIAQKAEVVFSKVRGRLCCADCGFEGEISMHEDLIYHYATPDLRCPHCRSGNITLVQGREAVVKSIRIQTRPPGAQKKRRSGKNHKSGTPS